MSKIQPLVILEIAFFLLNSREGQTSYQCNRELIFENPPEHTFTTAQKKSYETDSRQYASLTTISKA